MAGGEWETVPTDVARPALNWTTSCVYSALVPCEYINSFYMLLQSILFKELNHSR